MVDPRFPGGTSSAVIQELQALHETCNLKVAFVDTKMFSKASPHKKLCQTIEDLGIPVIAQAKKVSADTVVLHNPSMLKFNSNLDIRVYCRNFVAVAHENFYLPPATPDALQEAFDIDLCLGFLETNVCAVTSYIAPISAWNRRTVDLWMKAAPRRWKTTKFDWNNICDFEMLPPTQQPKDRRGRHSRPGFEKFSSLDDLRRTFSQQAEHNTILGANHLMNQPDCPDNIELAPFGSKDVDAFLSEIDFFVYFTNPNWQESFGRVVAEAIAAGKLVITNATTAENFGNTVIAARPDEVDDIISNYIRNPADYVAQVEKAQAYLRTFSSTAFQQKLTTSELAHS